MDRPPHEVVPPDLSADGGHSPLKPWPAYGVAVVATAITLGVRLALDASLGGRPTLVIFTLPIMVSAYAGGWPAGLLATALSCLAANYYLLEPIHSLRIASGVEYWQPFFLTLSGVVISVLNEAFHRVRHQARIVTGEQLQLVRQLETDRARLVAAQAVAKMGSWETDLSTLAVIWSDETHRIFETSPKTFQPTHAAFLDLIHPDDRVAVDSAFVRSIGQPGDQAIEHRVLMPDGRIKFIEERWQTFSDDQGRPLRATGTCQDISARKLAEEALRDSNQKFEQLTDNITDAFWIRSADMRELHYISPAFERIWGRTVASLYANPQEWTNFILPEDRELVVKAFARLTAGGPESLDIEYRIARPDGEVRWVRVRGFQVRDAAGTLIRHSGIVTDITQSKRAHLEIASTHRALTMLSECNEALIRAVGEPELLNEICRITVEVGGYRMAWVGYRQDDEARSIAPLAHAGVEDGFLSEVRATWNEHNTTGQGPAGQAIRKGQAVVCQDLALNFKTLPWFALTAARGYRGVICLPLRDPDRTFGVLALYSADVHETSSGELKLLQEMADNLSFGMVNLRAQSEQRRLQVQVREQAALLDIAHEAIQVRDLDGRIIYWNKGAEHIYGWTAAEVLGRTAVEMFYNDSARFREAMVALVATGTWDGEVITHTRDGRDITVEGRWTLVRDADGRPKSVLAIDTDITEKKRLETQFLRAQRMESIGTLAGGIAHDLNNVLAPILMSVEFLNELARSDDDRALVATLHASAQRGADLVKQVLSFARGVEGERILVNPLHLMRDLLKVMGDTFPKSIDVRFSPVPHLWTVTGDRTQMHQVFLNLCINARDAMPDGGRLTVSMANVLLDENDVPGNFEGRPGAFVMLTVQDTGTGIPPETRDRIFEPFFTTKEIGKGTGLGLSTTLAIVKSHQGFIRLDSELGTGTTFRVYLPANTTEAATEQVALEPIRLPRGHGELILVVDDEEGIRALAQRTLERYGYRVLLACQGAAAVSLYARHRADIAAVLTDMTMPIMDGPALIIALKAIDPRVRVIGSSGLTSSDGVDRAVGEAVEHFLPKPYTADGLLNILRTVLLDDSHPVLVP